jgi:hypothetical protein
MIRCYLLNILTSVPVEPLHSLAILSGVASLLKKTPESATMNLVGLARGAVKFRPI